MLSGVSISTAAAAGMTKFSYKTPTANLFDFMSRFFVYIQQLAHI